MKKRVLSFVMAVIMIASVVSPVISVEAAPVPATVPLKTDGVNRTVTIDGAISESEWGKPIATYTSGNCWDTKYAREDGSRTWDFYKNVDKPEGQKVEIYSTKDSQNLYIGVKLVNASPVDNYKWEIGQSDGIFNYSHLTLLVGKYDAKTTIFNAPYNEADYEHYNGWVLGREWGTAWCNRTFSQGMAQTGLKAPRDNETDPDFDIKYTDNSYIYEIRIPFSATEISPTDAFYVMSMELADSYTGDADTNVAGKNNIYQLSMAANRTRVVADEANRTLVKENSPMVVALSDCYVNTDFNKMPAIAPTVDANVSVSEYGEPTMLLSSNYCEQQWDGGYWGSEPAYRTADQRLKVWLTNDSQYLYVAAALDHEEPGAYYNDPSNSYAYPQFGIGLGGYAADTIMEEFEFEGVQHNRYTSYNLRFDASGNAVLGTGKHGHDMDVSLTSSDYAARYDADSKTFFYELRIPYTKLPFSLYNSRDLAVGIHVGAFNHNGGDNNRWNIGGPGYANFPYNANTQYSNRCLHMVANEVIDTGDCYVNSSFSVMPSVAPVADGTVKPDEYGNPTLVVSPDYCEQKWTDGYWGSEAAYRNKNQRLNAWLTNDADYVYVAATLDYEEAGTYYDSAKAYAYPQLGIALGDYADGTIMKEIVFQSEMYSCYTAYNLHFDASGTAVLSTNKQGHEQDVSLGAGDFAARYDEDTKTFHYELRIPMSCLPFDLIEDQDLAVSIHVGAFNHNGGDNNRYNVGGAGYANFPYVARTNYSGRCLKFTANEASVPEEAYYRSVVPEFPAAVPVLDGVIGEAEYGEAVVVAGGDTIAAQYGANALWTSDPAHYSNKQRAKIWMNNDADYLYVAGQLDRESKGLRWKAEDNGTTTGNWDWTYPKFSFAASQYNEETVVSDLVKKFVVSWDAFGNPTVGGDVKLSANDYAAKYDMATGTYSYELRIPLWVLKIDPAVNADLAISACIGASHRDDTLENNRWNIGGPGAIDVSYQTSGATGYFTKMTLNDTAATPATGSYGVASTDIALTPNSGITIDGTLENAWGDPTISADTRYAYETEGWGLDIRALDPSQKANVYLNNDDSYLYVAASISNVAPEGATPDKYWLQGGTTFGIAFNAVDTEKNQPKQGSWQGDDYEYTQVILVGPDKNGNACSRTAVYTGLDTPSIKLAAGDYAVKYDEPTKTYYYELRIPLGQLGDIQKQIFTDPDSAKMYMSFMVRGLSLNGGYNNFKLTSGCFDHIYPLSDPNDPSAFVNQMWNFAMKESSLLMKFHPAEKVASDYGWQKTELEAAPEAGFTMDGVLESGWGDPIANTDMRYALQTAGWDVSIGRFDAEQEVNVYAKNDDRYLYVAATIDHVAPEKDYGTASSWDRYWIHKYSSFAIALNPWDPATDQPKGAEYLGDKYEYTHVIFFGQDMNGNTHSRTMVFTGHDAPVVSVSESDFAIKYDEATQTYTYEVRIPLGQLEGMYDCLFTEPDLAKMYMSFMVRGRNEDGSVNTYGLTSGCFRHIEPMTYPGEGLAPEPVNQMNNFAMKDSSALVKLHGIEPVASDYGWRNTDIEAVEKRLMIDGELESEWGEPTASTDMRYALQTEGWTAGVGKYDPDQEVNVYVKNDDRYLYLAATIDHVVKEKDFGTASCWDNYWIHKYSSFAIAFNPYDDLMDRPSRGSWQGDDYEFTHVIFMGQDMNGNNYARTKVFTGHGTPIITVDPADFAIRYDEANQTYIYEARIALSKFEGLTDALSNNPDAAKQYMSFMVRGRNEDGSINTYGLTSGCYKHIEPMSQASPGSAPEPVNQMWNFAMDESSKLMKFAPVAAGDLIIAETAAEHPVLGLELDGDIEASWGDPMISVDAKDVMNTVGMDANIGEMKPDQHMDIYVNNDDSYLYIAARMDQVEKEEECWDKYWVRKYSALGIAFNEAVFDENGVASPKQGEWKGDKYEYTQVLFVGPDREGNPIAVENVFTGFDKPQVTFGDDDFGIKYDEANKTYSYELRIPLSAFGGVYKNLYQDPEKAKLFISFMLRGRNADGSINTYAITTGAYDHVEPMTQPSAGAAYDFVNQMNNFGMARSSYLLRLADAVKHVDTYILDTVSPAAVQRPGSIKIDGKIGNGEYGDPVIVATPYALGENGQYWETNKSALRYDAVGKVYITNDDKYVYFASTLSNVPRDTNYTGNPKDKFVGYDAWRFAHMCVTLGLYDEEYGISHVKSMGKWYERFTKLYVLEKNVDGKMVPCVSIDTSGKIDRQKLDESDYYTSYDEATQTYTYELRVPLSITSLRFGNGNKMACSVQLNLPYETYQQDFAAYQKTVDEGKPNSGLIKSGNSMNIGGIGAAQGGNKGYTGYTKKEVAQGYTVNADGAQKPLVWAHQNNSMVFTLNDNPYTDGYVYVSNPHTDVSAVAPWMGLVALISTAAASMAIIIPRSKEED